MTIFGKEYKIVSEKDQKDKSNTLYLYIEKIDGVTYAKFGEAFKQTVWDRYAATGYTQHSKQIKVWKSSVGDKPIHRLLRSMFTWAGNKSANPLNTNEAYIIKSSDELDNMIDTITDIVKNQKIGPDFFRNRCENLTYSPRSYQQDIINKAQNVLSVKDRVLVNLSTRGGKSFVSLNICKNIIGKTKTENILILTPFPAAEGSFEEVANLHKDFKGWKYIRLSAKTKADEFCDKNIIFCSYQFYDEGKAICQKLIKDLFLDVIVLDECHNTSDSDRTVKLLKTLNYGKLLYMSGTPFNDIYSGYFTKDEVVTFDFIDFIKFAKAHPDEVKLPNLHIKNVCNISMLQEQLTALSPTVFEDADVFDFPTIFSNDQHAEAFFTWLFRPVKSNPLVVNTKRWFDLNDQKRVIAFFSTTAQVDVAKKALEKLLPNYKVLSVSGEDTDFTSVDERKVNDAFKEENTIILTCGKLTTGVTLPMLDTIWYFKNTASAEQFIQILFRTMTPCDGKTDATMYCFDSEASLKVVKEYATVRLDEMSTNISKGENDTYQTVISDILSCINFTYLSGKYQWESEDPDDYFEKLHKLPYSHSVVAAFQNFSSFDGVEDIGTEELKEKDLTITKAQGEATKGQCDRNNKLKQLFRESKSSNDDADERERTSNKVVKQLLKLLLNIDKKIFVNDFVKSYKDLEKLMPEELKDYKDNYLQLLEDNKARLNQMIEDIRYKESHGKVDELLQGFSYSNSTDMKTPEALLDKMFGKFSDYNGTICDPCVGVGTMLRYAVEKCGFKKENCYGIDINEDNVKICRKLGFVNIIQGDAQDPKTWEKLNMNFDKTIMNPPYDKNLHLKILREAMKHSDDIVNLSPNFYEDYKKLDDVPVASDIEVIPREEASIQFGGIQLAFNLSIQHYVKGQEDKTLLTRFMSEDYKKFSKVKFGKSFKDVFTPDYDGKGVFVPLKLMTTTWDKNKDHIVDKIGILVDGKTLDGTYYKDARNRNKDRPCGGIKFDTLEEAKAFVEYTETPFFIRWVNAFHTNSRYILSEYPFMPTYEHPWTDEELYEYFGLDDEERAEIEKEIK
jgi:superfamily II DNA or RNA helicase/23S rRNA U2552 (ribose-2'-O)-methylase RlmE/FtsJ